MKDDYVIELTIEDITKGRADFIFSALLFLLVSIFRLTVGGGISPAGYIYPVRPNEDLESEENRFIYPHEFQLDDFVDGVPEDDYLAPSIEGGQHG